MITERKLSVAEVGRRIWVSENLLHAWKKAVLKGGAAAFPGAGHLTPGRGRAAPPPGQRPAPGDRAGRPKKATAFFATQTK